MEEGVGALGEDTTTLNKVGTEEASLGCKPEEEEAELEEEETESTGTKIELQEYKRCFHLPDIEKQMGLDTIHAIQHLVSIEKKALISAIEKEEAKIEKSPQKRQRTAVAINTYGSVCLPYSFPLELHSD